VQTPCGDYPGTYVHWLVGGHVELMQDHAAADDVAQEEKVEKRRGGRQKLPRTMQKTGKNLDQSVGCD